MEGLKELIRQTNVSEAIALRLIDLIDSGATIPFISRYRKEATGGMDEVQIEHFVRSLKLIRDLVSRKETIIKAATDAGLLTEKLLSKIQESWNSEELEDIYLPFKPKRKTRGQAARELGLEPLAKQLMSQQSDDVEFLAGKYLKLEVSSTTDALAGARDILAEWMSENAALRGKMRNLYRREAMISSKASRGKSTDEDAQKFRDYFDFSESWRKCPSHRFLAIQRGANEGFLKISLKPDDRDAEDLIIEFFVKSKNEAAEQVRMAALDAYKRLIQPSMETEFLQQMKEKAEIGAVEVFAQNLKQLLLQAPVGGKKTLAIDPGFRTGCKVVCLDEHGELQHNETIYPHPPQKEFSQSVKKLENLVSSYKIECISIGNGTAGRETETLVRKCRFDRPVEVYVVNEAGASIYSASSIGRAEFPKHDVTVRGAVSIGRRLQDPLAELVKIEPHHIGVGQYQHDIDPKRMEDYLGRTVESCVNNVGVELNTASPHLLKYVSGIGPALADQIVNYRRENGGFQSRSELMNVPRLGAKAYEQCAGFLRVIQSANPLDKTNIHPERYKLVESIAKSAKVSVENLLGDATLIDQINWQSFESDEVGKPTLDQIKAELLKPGQDSRKRAKVLEFADVHKVSDLSVGMVLPGIVTNLTNFGAFVDVGVKQDGLIHISQMADRFISNPQEVVHLHQHVEVEVLEVDEARKRIGFKLIKPRG